MLIGADDVIQIMYTSGTESRPKGVSLTSSSLIAQYVSCIVEGGMTDDDVEIHSLPFYHCAQMHCFLTPDLYLGATSIVLPRPDPALICATIERERVTKLFCPPTVWISLLRSPAFEQHDLSSLREGLLRRVDHAGRGAEGDRRAPPADPPVELLRADGDGAAGDDPQAARPGRASGIGRDRRR